MNTNNTTESHCNTTYTEGLIRRYYVEFVICSVLTVPFALAALYIAGAQVSFFLLKKFYSGKNNENETTGSGHSGKNTTRDYNAMTIVLMCVFATTTGFLRVGFDLRWVFGRDKDFECNIALKFKFVTNGLSILAVYLVLWLKQRIFYEDPKLKHLSSKFIRFLSWSVGIVFVIFVILGTALSVYAKMYEGTPYGCLSAAQSSSDAFNIILLCTAPFFQVCLLGLLVYPMIKHYRTTKPNTGSTKHEGTSVIDLIKRSTITSAICIGTDLLVAVIDVFLGPYGTINIFIYDINIVVDNFFLIHSFPDWRQRLMPWKLLGNRNKVVVTD